MTIDDKIRGGKLQNDREVAIISAFYHLEKLINTNILQARKSCSLINVE